MLFRTLFHNFTIGFAICCWLGLIPATAGANQAGLFRPESVVEVEDLDSLPDSSKEHSNSSQELTTIANNPPDVVYFKELNADEELAESLESQDIKYKRPYFLEVNEKKEKKPYFLKDETPPKKMRPYFLADSENLDDLKKDEVSIVDSLQKSESLNKGLLLEKENAAASAELLKPSESIFAPAVKALTPEEIEALKKEKLKKELEVTNPVNKVTYYMFRDEFGVVHASNVPTDSRYKPFTMEVEVRIRAVPGKKIKFTHEELRPYILKAALIHDLDPALIAAIIKAESAFDPNAVSWAGAQGLMQLIPSTAALVGCKNSFDPEQNIMGGSRYIRMMLDRFGGDLSLALAAYNAGPGNVEKKWRIPNIKETQNYVKIVLSNYEGFKEHFR